MAYVQQQFSIAENDLTSQSNFEHNNNEKQLLSYSPNMYGTTTSVNNEELLIPGMILMQRTMILFLFIISLIQLVGFYRYRTKTHKKREKYLPLRGCGSNFNFTSKKSINPESPKRPQQPNHQQSRPSPKHPALEHVPSFLIRLETMKVLRMVGIRVIAHGIESQSRRVWISIDDQSLIWHSEYKTKLPNNAGDSSLLSMRGPSHRIDWEDMKYIHVGKNTNALKQLPANVSGKVCFSILTDDGSLDFQAKSKLERDALVSCLCNMLDEYKKGNEWRESNKKASSVASDRASKASSSLFGSDIGTV